MKILTKDSKVVSKIVYVPVYKDLIFGGSYRSLEAVLPPNSELAPSSRACILKVQFVGEDLKIEVVHEDQ